MDWTPIIIAAIGGGGLITTIVEVVKLMVGKKKTPYDAKAVTMMLATPRAHQLESG